MLQSRLLLLVTEVGLVLDLCMLWFVWLAECSVFFNGEFFRTLYGDELLFGRVVGVGTAVKWKARSGRVERGDYAGAGSEPCRGPVRSGVETGDWPAWPGRSRRRRAAARQRTVAALQQESCAQLLRERDEGRD